MGRKGNRYGQHVIGLGQLYNKSNEAVYCRYCSESQSYEVALENTRMPKTKKMIKTHLRKCPSFAKYLQESGNKWDYTDDESSEIEKDKTMHKHSDQLIELIPTSSSAATESNLDRPTQRIRLAKRPAPAANTSRTIGLDSAPGSLTFFEAEVLREKRLKREVMQQRLEFEKMQFKTLMEHKKKKLQEVQAAREHDREQLHFHRMYILERLDTYSEKLFTYLEALSKNKPTTKE